MTRAVIDMREWNASFRQKEMGNSAAQRDVWLSKIVPRCPTYIARRRSQTWASKRVIPVNVYRMSQKKTSSDILLSA